MIARPAAATNWLAGEYADNGPRRAPHARPSRAHWSGHREWINNAGWLEHEHECLVVIPGGLPGAHPASAVSQQLPLELQHLDVAIEESRELLERPDDWDGEGSPGYDEETWQRATGFLLANAVRLWNDYGVIIDAPEISPGPAGSIDLHWRSGRRELLINVPANPGMPAGFYGDDRTGNAVKGQLDVTEENQWLLMWLSE